MLVDDERDEHTVEEGEADAEREVQSAGTTVHGEEIMLQQQQQEGGEEDDEGDGMGGVDDSLLQNL